MKYVEYEKLSKKKKKEYDKAQRVMNGFNTGSRDMKSEKYPSRAKQKRDLKRDWE